MGRPPSGDWDLATSARPEAMQRLFGDRARYENAFGTVAVEVPEVATGEAQITTFRTDHDYADFRRPHHVEFGDDIRLDLARRDFTINAMAWGAEPGGAAPTLIDPFGGRADLAGPTLRAVGEPGARFDEDALRMVRAVRLAATLDAAIEPATLAAIQSRADNVRHLSGERIAAELEKLLRAERPSVGLRLLADTGLLAGISPELAAQRGIPQSKVPGEDLWDHSLRAVDGAAREPERIRMAALLHDIGKPATMADGRFIGHEAVGAEQAAELLDRLRWPRAERERIVHLIRHHMFGYEPSWSDTAVRRFIAKLGKDALEDMYLLRRADNIGSGRDPEAGHLAELRARVRRELDADVVLDLHGLAIDGNDLMAELGLPPGPELGRVLDGLLERVIADPSINRRSTLLAEARAMQAAGPSAATP
jgi:putative nucleotidyltransferase with HDIG domain